MVRPSSFGFDEQTARTNTFQHDIEYEAASAIQKRAEAEFEAFVSKLRRQSVDVVVFDDSPLPPKPGGVFPNNWLTTWPDGRVYLYPMATKSRRSERNPAALDLLKLRFTAEAIRDISATENEGGILEGTGAMVFDHPHKIVYASISPRCSEDVFRRHARDLGYQPITFHSYSENGVPIYHTNVMMGVQSTTAVVCSESITDELERKLVLDTLRRTGHEVIEISYTQMNQFCGNVLEVQNTRGERLLVLSGAAYDAFTDRQRDILSQDKTLLRADIPTIETVGGGSARCMIAEVFLPLKNRSPVYVQ